MNILLADDDLLVTTALKIILESDPELHIVDTASSGGKLLHFLKNTFRTFFLWISV